MAELAFRSSGKREDLAPFPFTLDEETFWCKPELPGSLILENEALVFGGSRGLAASAVLGFFEHAMSGQFAPEDPAAEPAPENPEAEPAAEPQPPARRVDEYTRFRRYVDDADRMVQLADIGDIYVALVREYTRRPTKRSTGSPDGPQPTPDGSTEGSP